MKTESTKCKDLAINILLNNRRISNSGKELVLLAGSNIYTDTWTRDGFLGALGLLSLIISVEENKTIEYKKIIIKFYEILLDNQSNEGMIPLRVGTGTLGQTYQILFKKSLNQSMPIYLDDKNSSLPTDSCSQFIILSYLIYKYVDKEIIRENIKSIKKCFKFILDTFYKEELIQGTHFNSWYDTYTFDGADLFSNTLFLYAIKCFIILLKEINDKNEDVIYINNEENNEVNQNCFIEEELKKLYNKTFKKYKENFWVTINGFSYLKIHKDIEVADVAGNCLAILFELLSEYENNCIMNFLNVEVKAPMAHVNYPKVPFKYIFFPLYIFGMEGYHNDRYWLWVHFLYLTTCKKTGRKITLIKDIEESILINNTFYENVDTSLEEVRNILQSSEKDFTCSAGMYLLYYYNKSSMFKL